MMCQYKYRKRILAMVVMVVVGICMAPVCFANEDDVSSTNNKANSQIKEIPDMGSEGDRDFVGDVEKQFDVIGVVDAVQEEGIVVNDTYFKKAPKAQTYRVKTGSRVGVMLNGDGEVTFCEPVKKEHR